jgi:hypothetical protein
MKLSLFLNALVLCLGLMATPTFAADDCKTVTAWVQANEGNLPTSYQDFIHQPQEYQKGIFAALSPAARSNLWREHFSQFLAENPQLSADQVSFVKQATLLASPQFFAKPDYAALEQLVARGEQLFASSELSSLFAQLGSTDNSNVGTTGVACECSTRSDWCWNRGADYFCTTYYYCDYSSSGCGTWFAYSCNGLCVR